MSHLQDSSRLPDHVDQEIRDLINELKETVMPILKRHHPSLSISALMVVFTDMLCCLHKFDPVETIAEISILNTAMIGNAFNIIAKQQEEDERENED